MPLRHGPDCRCPPLPADAGLLAYTVDCEHRERLAELLAAMAARPDTSTLGVLPPKRLPVLESPQSSPVINRNPAPQPWEPRPPRRRAA